MFVPRAVVCQPQIYRIAGLVLDAENIAEKMRHIAGAYCLVAETGVEHRIISSGTLLETVIGVSNGKKCRREKRFRVKHSLWARMGNSGFILSVLSKALSLSLAAIWRLFGRGKNENRPAERWTE